MKQKDGSSVIGIWLYSQDKIRYEKNDLIIGKIADKSYIGRVTQPFISTNYTDQQALENFCDTPATDFNYITEAQVKLMIDAALRYFSITSGVAGGLTTLENASVADITEPGLYKIHKTTQGLPAQMYDPSNPSQLTDEYAKQSYLRVSNEVDEQLTTVIFEVFSFAKKNYFAGAGDLGQVPSWTCYVANGVTEAASIYNAAIASLALSNADAQNVIAGVNQRLRYKYNNQATIFNHDHVKFLDLFCEDQVN